MCSKALGRPGVPGHRPRATGQGPYLDHPSRFPLCENSACHHLREDACSSRLGQMPLWGFHGLWVSFYHTVTTVGHPLGGRLSLPAWHFSEQGTTQNTVEHPGLPQGLVERPRAGAGTVGGSSLRAAGLQPLSRPLYPLTLTPLWHTECPSPVLGGLQMVQEGSSAVAAHDRRWMVGPGPQSCDERPCLSAPSSGRQLPGSPANSPGLALAGRDQAAPRQPSSMGTVSLLQSPPLPRSAAGEIWSPPHRELLAAGPWGPALSLGTVVLKPLLNGHQPP